MSSVRDPGSSDGPDSRPASPPEAVDAGRSIVDRKERILEALGDHWSREILRMLNDAPRSAQEILAGNSIPPSTLYRKLHELSQLGLVGIQRSVISGEGKRVELYRSRLDELRVEMHGERLRIDVRLRDLAAERLKEMWRNVRREAARS